MDNPYWVNNQALNIVRAYVDCHSEHIVDYGIAYLADYDCDAKTAGKIMDVVFEILIGAIPEHCIPKKDDFNGV